jgi:hypothetical protein
MSTITMSDTEAPAATADEQPKRKIAKKVVTPKHRYFSPSHGNSVTLASPSNPEGAVNLHDKKAHARKGGDA